MYSAQTPPPSENVEAVFIDFLSKQFRDLEAAMLEQAFGGLPLLFASPSKPREGMFVNADGTTWNPGAGAGIYVYHATVWKKVHA